MKVIVVYKKAIIAILLSNPGWGKRPPIFKENFKVEGKLFFLRLWIPVGLPWSFLVTLGQAVTVVLSFWHPARLKNSIIYFWFYCLRFLDWSPNNTDCIQHRAQVVKRKSNTSLERDCYEREMNTSNSYLQCKSVVKVRFCCIKISFYRKKRRQKGGASLRFSRLTITTKPNPNPRSLLMYNDITKPLEPSHTYLWTTNTRKIDFQPEFKNDMIDFLSGQFTVMEFHPQVPFCLLFYRFPVNHEWVCS